MKKSHKHKIKSISLLFILFVFGVTTSFGLEAVNWTNLVNVTATSSSVEKTGGVQDVADAGAVSQQQITSGNGYIEFTVPANKAMGIGLGNDTSNSTTDTNIDYSFSITGNSYWEIRENGTYRSDGTFTVNSVFKIEIDGIQVKYYVDNTLVYTSSVAPTYPLVFDTSFLGLNSEITTPQISISSTPPSNCTPSVKTDRGIYPEPTLPILPAAGGKFCDPTFGTEIMRVTDAGDNGSYGTEYSNYSSLNMDNTQLYVYGNQSFIIDFDPQNFTLGTNKRLLSSISGGTIYNSGVTWSNSDPNKLYGVEPADGLGAIIYEVNTQTMTKSVIANLNGSPNFSTGDYLAQMTVSEDGNVFAFTRKDSTYNDVGIVVYDDSLGQIIFNENLPFQAGIFDEVEIDKTGRYLLIKNPNSTYESFIKDFQTGNLTGITDGGPDFGPGHSGNGTGIVIGAENWNHTILKRNMLTPGNYTLAFDYLGDLFVGIHISLKADDENWFLVSSSSTAYDFINNTCGASRNEPFRNEIYLIKSDGSQEFKRLAHNRTVEDQCINGQSVDYDYFHTPRANISKDGKFIAFTSSWGSVGTNSRHDMFILKVPETTTPNQSNEVIWQDVQSTTATANDVEHNGNSYYAMARSQQEILSGAGYFEFTFDGDLGVVGLGNGTPANNGDASDLDFAFSFGNATTYEIYESGVYQGDGSASVGDVFRIELTPTGDVVYKKNGNVLSISRSTNPTLTYPYFLVFKAQDEPPYNQSISDAKFQD